MSAEFTRDDFLRWADDPLTCWVARACGLQAKELQDDWMNASWVSGECDPIRLAVMRARADTLQILASPSYESICALHGMEPNEG
jgi:hypothetical protein